MSSAAFVAITTGVVLVPVALGLAVRRPLQARLSRGTGLMEWKLAACRHPPRRVWLGGGVLLLVLTAVSLVSLAIVPGDRSTVVNLVLQSALGVMFLLQPRLLRRQQRSLELIRAATVS